MEENRQRNGLFERAKIALARNSSTFEFNRIKEFDHSQESLMNRLADLTNSIVTVFDPSSLEYLFVSNNTKASLGHPPRFWKEGGFRKHLTLIHPDEVEANIHFHEIGMSMYKNTPLDQKLAFKMCMDMRMRCKNGSFRKFARTSLPFATDSEGNVLAWLNSYQDITHLKKNSSICFFVQEGDMLVRIFRYTLETNDYERIPPFTRREQEVLKGMAEGLDTNALADRLSLTPTTVAAHRRRLVEKTAAFNPESMVTYLTVVGVLNSDRGPA